jgi:hypothetical protein
MAILIKSLLQSGISTFEEQEALSGRKAVMHETGQQMPCAGYKPADIRNARKLAGARKPYSPPVRAVPPTD